jgi:hypothetical protein
MLANVLRLRFRENALRLASQSPTMAARALPDKRHLGSVNSAPQRTFATREFGQGLRRKPPASTCIEGAA